MPKKHHDHFGQIIRALYIYISFQYHFILVSWISSWRTNCFRESNSSRFSTLEIHYLSEWYFAFHTSIMDHQLENQLFQGNQGSLLWRFISVVNDSLYFFVSWISKWRSNCFREPSSFRFSDHKDHQYHMDHYYHRHIIIILDRSSGWQWPP